MTIEGKQHPGRDAQFGYLNAQAEEHMAAGCPVISVTPRRRSWSGGTRTVAGNGGPAASPSRSTCTTSPTRTSARPSRTASTTWRPTPAAVSVGTDHDTSQFAVQAIRRWWDTVGKDAYPDAGRLLISADGGGSNGHRTRSWKTELAELAAETGLEISVCHLQPGTSKWNKIEHRLFSHISMNWRGKPLTSHEVIVEHHRRDHHPHRAQASTPNSTPAAIRKASRFPTSEMKALEQAWTLIRHAFHGDWNYRAPG